jgi:hypothetical protein
MLSAFMAGVSSDASARACDPKLPLPFANLEDGRGRKKQHGIAEARAPRVRPNQPRAKEARSSRPVERDTGVPHDVPSRILIAFRVDEVTPLQIERRAVREL